MTTDVTAKDFNPSNNDMVDELIDQYREKFGDIWADGVLENIPNHMIDGFCRYVLFGMSPGSFLTSVLTNDLMGALLRADSMNRHGLWYYGNALHNYAPSNCFGSPELFEAWREQKGSNGQDIGLY